MVHRSSWAATLIGGFSFVPVAQAIILNARPLQPTDDRVLRVCRPDDSVVARALESVQAPGARRRPPPIFLVDPQRTSCRGVAELLGVDREVPFIGEYTPSWGWTEAPRIPSKFGITAATSKLMDRKITPIILGQPNENPKAGRFNWREYFMINTLGDWQTPMSMGGINMLGDAGANEKTWVTTQFDVKRNGVTQKFEGGNTLQVGDTLQFIGPPVSEKSSWAIPPYGGDAIPKPNKLVARRAAFYDEGDDEIPVYQLHWVPRHSKLPETMFAVVLEVVSLSDSNAEPNIELAGKYNRFKQQQQNAVRGREDGKTLANLVAGLFAEEAADGEATIPQAAEGPGPDIVKMMTYQDAKMARDEQRYDQYLNDLKKEQEKRMKQAQEEEEEANLSPGKRRQRRITMKEGERETNRKIMGLMKSFVADKDFMESLGAGDLVDEPMPNEPERKRDKVARKIGNALGWVKNKVPSIGSGIDEAIEQDRTWEKFYTPVDDSATWSRIEPTALDIIKNNPEAEEIFHNLRYNLAHDSDMVPNSNLKFEWPPIPPVYVDPIEQAARDLFEDPNERERSRRLLEEEDLDDSENVANVAVGQKENEDEEDDDLLWWDAGTQSESIRQQPSGAIQELAFLRPPEEEKVDEREEMQQGIGDNSQKKSRFPAGRAILNKGDNVLSRSVESFNTLKGGVKNLIKGGWRGQKMPPQDQPSEKKSSWRSRFWGKKDGEDPSESGNI